MHVVLSAGVGTVNFKFITKYFLLGSSTLLLSALSKAPVTIFLVPPFALFCTSLMINSIMLVRSCSRSLGFSVGSGADGLDSVLLLGLPYNKGEKCTEVVHLQR